MPRFLLAAALFALPAVAANWTEYRIGPFHVISNAGDRAARERLNEMEQLRYVLGTLLGKDNLDLVWPLDLIVSPNVPPQSLVDGGSATLAAWTPDFPRQLTRLLIDNNAGRMPEATETALCDLLSTIQVSGTRVMLGAPPSNPTAAWAKLQMLATQPEYGSKLRVYLNNLQQGGDEGVAARNAFDITVVELNRRADAYWRAGGFAAAPVSGEALNPNRDFVEKAMPQSSIDDLLAELKAGGKDFPSDSPRGLVAKGTRPALELAAKAVPRWAEPHVKLAALQNDPAAQAKELKIAATLEPRNSGYWQALAVAQAAAEQYAEADKSWNLAERNAPNETERERIHQSRLEMDEHRAAFEIAERKRLADERIAEVERVRNGALAEIHAAEDAANKSVPGLKPGQTAVPWWTEADGEKLSGTLTRVDCLQGPLRLTVQPASGPTIRVLIRDQKSLTLKGGTDKVFGCGVQKPTRKVNLVHNGKPDANLGTAGDILMLEFP